MKNRFALAFSIAFFSPLLTHAEPAFSPLLGEFTMVEIRPANAETKSIVKTDAFGLIDIFKDGNTETAVVWASSQWRFSKNFLTIRMKIIMQMGDRFAWTECSDSTPINWNRNKLTVLESIAGKTTSGFTTKSEPDFINCQVNQAEKTFEVRKDGEYVILRSGTGNLLLDTVYRKGAENADLKDLANNFKQKLKK